MTFLVVGASGATGRLLVEQLLDRGQSVKAIVRPGSRLPDSLRAHPSLTLIEASLLDMTDHELAEVVAGCRGIASCLGHNLNFKGMYGKPQRLVTDAVRKLCQVAIRLNESLSQTGEEQVVKFCLMSSSGVVNHHLNEKVSIANKILTGLIRALVPPHADNEAASAYLQSDIGDHYPTLQWVAVRPDGLVDEESVSEYKIFPSPIRDPILDAGKTSRINVAHFMVELLTDEALWSMWQGQTPVVYNAESTAQVSHR